MSKSLYLLVFVLALALAYAATPQSSSSGSSATQTPSQTQPSSAPDQTPAQSQPSTKPDQTQTPATQPGSSAQAATAGGDVQTQIQNALKNDPTLSNDNINVTVTDKDVELTGTVGSKAEKDAAKKIAEQNAGKLKVKDKLKVEKSNPGGSQPTSNPSSKPPGNSFMPAAQTGSASGAQQQTPPSSSSPSSAGSSSGTEQQTQPSSSAPSAPASTPSSSSPSSTPGAAGSASQSTEPQSGAGASASANTGGDVQTQIQNALKNEPTLSNDNINVAVTDDSIDLTGTVATGKEKQTAKRIVQSYAGNRKVKDHLTVSGKGQESMTPSDKGANPSTNPEDKKSKPPQN